MVVLFKALPAMLAKPETLARTTTQRPTAALRVQHHHPRQLVKARQVHQAHLVQAARKEDQVHPALQAKEAVSVPQAHPAHLVQPEEMENLVPKARLETTPLAEKERKVTTQNELVHRFANRHYKSYSISRTQRTTRPSWTRRTQRTTRSPSRWPWSSRPTRTTRKLIKS